MKWKFILCVCLLAFLSGCGLLERWALNTGEPVEPQAAALDQTLDRLLFPGDDCPLPCFGRLYPRESRIEAVEAFVDQFEVDGSAVQLRSFETGGYGLSFFFDPVGLLLINLLTEGNELAYITVNISDAQGWLSQTPYDLPTIFERYGAPDEIYILIAGPPTGFTLVVPYNGQGFMLRYQVTYDDDTELTTYNALLPICLRPEIVDLQRIDLWLQSPDEETLVESNQPDLRDNRDVRPFWTIQRMAGISVEEFAAFFVSNPLGCLPIPSLADLRAQGYVP